MPSKGFSQFSSKSLFFRECPPGEIMTAISKADNHGDGCLVVGGNSDGKTYDSFCYSCDKPDPSNITVDDTDVKYLSGNWGDINLCPDHYAVTGICTGAKKSDCMCQSIDGTTNMCKYKTSAKDFMEEQNFSMMDQRAYMLKCTRTNSVPSAYNLSTKLTDINVWMKGTTCNVGGSDSFVKKYSDSGSCQVFPIQSNKDRHGSSIVGCDDSDIMTGVCISGSKDDDCRKANSNMFPKRSHIFAICESATNPKRSLFTKYESSSNSAPAPSNGSSKTDTKDKNDSGTASGADGSGAAGSGADDTGADGSGADGSGADGSDESNSNKNSTQKFLSKYKYQIGIGGFVLLIFLYIMHRRSKSSSIDDDYDDHNSAQYGGDPGLTGYSGDLNSGIYPVTQPQQQAYPVARQVNLQPPPMHSPGPYTPSMTPRAQIPMYNHTPHGVYPMPVT